MSDLSDFYETRYSPLYKLLRVTAYVVWFVNKLKRDSVSGLLPPPELQRAKLYWQLYIQHKHYSKKISDIKHEKKGDLQSQLNLQMDKSGLLRCHGRFSNSDLTQGAKKRKLLPKTEYFTRLVIEYHHQKNVTFRCFSDIGTNSPRVLDSSRTCSSEAAVEELSSV